MGGGAAASLYHNAESLGVNSTYHGEIDLLGWKSAVNELSRSKTDPIRKTKFSGANSREEEYRKIIKLPARR
jgi:hypothetical protein